MPRTITPEEQKRVQDVSDLQNIKPTPKRTVFVDSDASGAPNVFIWNAGGDASLADGSEFIASAFTGFGEGEANEGVWQRLSLPFAGAARTDDLAEGSNLYYTEVRARNDFSASGDLTYSSSTGKLALDVSSLSASDLFGQKRTDDLPEGSSSLYFTGERSREAVDAALEGIGVDITYEESSQQNFGNPLIEIRGTETNPNISDDGTQITQTASDINFGTGIGALNDNGTADIPFLDQFGEATFDGDGSSTQYSVQHGLTFEPESVQVQAITDDASSISHIDYDDTVITVIYDTPPPVGTENLKIYYKLKVNLDQAPFWDNQGDLVFSFD